MMKSLVAALILASNLVFAQEAPQPPSETQIRRAKLAYRVLTWLAADIDAAFKAQKIEIESCTYQSDYKHVSTSYKGIGPCLFESFRESMHTASLSGRIYAWGSTPWGRLTGLRMEWRPVKGGWVDAIRTWLDLQLEPFFEWRKSEKMLSSQTFLGEMKMYFPSDFPVQKLELTSRPVQRKDGILEFEGTFLISSEKTQLHNTVISWDTNLNPLRTERHFYFRGHTQVPTEVMP